MPAAALLELMPQSVMQVLHSRRNLEAELLLRQPPALPERRADL